MFPRGNKILTSAFCLLEETNQAALYSPFVGELGGFCSIVFDNIAIEYSVIDRRQAALPYRRLKNRHTVSQITEPVYNQLKAARRSAL